MPEQTLDALMAGIGTAIKQAQHAVEAFGLKAFENHFEPQRGAVPGQTELRPKTIALPIPHPDGTYRVRDVPVAGLVHHHALHLDEVTVRMRVSVIGGENGEPLKLDVGPLRPDAGDDSGYTNLAEIELVFRRGEAPEGVARIATRYHQQL